MAFKRSAVRSRLSPPTKRTPKGVLFCWCKAGSKRCVKKTVRWTVFSTEGFIRPDGPMWASAPTTETHRREEPVALYGTAYLHQRKGHRKVSFFFGAKRDRSGALRKQSGGLFLAPRVSECERCLRQMQRARRTVPQQGEMSHL